MSEMLGPDKEPIPVMSIFMIADLIGDRIFICRPNSEKVSWAEIEEFMETVISNTGDHEPHLNEEQDLLVFEFNDADIATEVLNNLEFEAVEQRLIHKTVDDGTKKLTYLLFK